MRELQDYVSRFRSRGGKWHNVRIEEEKAPLLNGTERLLAHPFAFGAYPRHTSKAVLI